MCPKGYFVTGGGFYAGAITEIISSPLPNLRGWFVDGTNTTKAKRTFQHRATAVCAKGTPVTTTTPAAPGRCCAARNPTSSQLMERWQRTSAIALLVIAMIAAVPAAAVAPPGPARNPHPALHRRSAPSPDPAPQATTPAHTPTALEPGAHADALVDAGADPASRRPPR